jgi:UDP:flavonoid glycosyltransferase YjiC (YdhE family)
LAEAVRRVVARPTYAARARALQAAIRRTRPLDTIAEVLLAVADPPGGGPQ